MGVEQITQYNGKDQVDFKVEVQVPGSWFGGTDAGSLTATERREQYKAQAVEFAAVHDFPAGRGGGKRTKESAIRFICIEDAADDPHSKGYWMKLLQWNRYLHETYKSRPAAEHPFRKEEPESDAPPPTTKPSKPIARIKTIYKDMGKGTHTKQDGGVVAIHNWKCTQKSCKHPTGIVMEMGSGTGQMFRHLKTCNPALWRELKLESKHSKLVLGSRDSAALYFCSVLSDRGTECAVQSESSALSAQCSDSALESLCTQCAVLLHFCVFGSTAQCTVHCVGCGPAINCSVVIVVNTVFEVNSQKFAGAASGGLFSRALVTVPNRP